MGKSLLNSSCFPINPSRRRRRRSPDVTLIFWKDGSIKILSGSEKHVAGEIMFEFPDQMVSHADSIFIGQQIQALAIDDELIPGQTYLILPINRFAGKILTTSSLLIIFDSNHHHHKQGARSRSTADFTGASSPSPFNYFQGSDGRLLIKVSQDFVIGLIRNNINNNNGDNNNNNKRDHHHANCSEKSDRNSDICDTPDLKRQYDQLVGSRDKIWSPKLETISEHKIRVSPCHFLGFI